jgi:hypothetical protein
MATGSLAAKRMPSTPCGDVVVDDRDLVVDVGLGRAVGRDLHVAELLRGLVAIPAEVAAK